ncbi:MAG: hypothetical protein LBU67_05295 [Oscillospiraceae bacterium]|jgi:hypothetical protein|nr:hypothetical protein [Oscillospiraceae bacterium]
MFRKKLRAILSAVVFALVSAMCVGMFYLAVILGETPALPGPAPGESVVPSALPTAAPSPAPLPGGMLQGGDTATRQALFPAPLAILPQADGFQVVSAIVEDIASKDTDIRCRVVTVAYQHPSFSGEVVLICATPPAYLERYAGADTHILDQPAALLGLPASALRLPGRDVWVARSGQAIYALETAADTLDMGLVAGRVTLFTPGQ